MMGGEGSHPLAESSGGETGEHSPAPGDLFACYKIQLILLPVLPGKEEQGRREDNERKGFKCLTVTFPYPRAGTEKPPNYPPARKHPEGGEAERGSRAGKQPVWPAGLVVGEMWLKAPHESTRRRHGDVCACPRAAKEWKADCRGAPICLGSPPGSWHLVLPHLSACGQGPAEPLGRMRIAAQSSPAP